MTLSLILQFGGLVIVIISMLVINLPLLLNYGPQGWIQYFMATGGYLFLLLGLFIDQWIFPDKKEVDIWHRALSCFLIALGPVVFVTVFITSINENPFGFGLTFTGLLFLIIGYVIRFNPSIRKFVISWKFTSLVIKVLLILWMVGLLIIFMIYWGAPNEFWSIIDRFGLGRTFHDYKDFFSHFFAFN